MTGEVKEHAKAEESGVARGPVTETLCNANKGAQ